MRTVKSNMTYGATVGPQVGHSPQAWGLGLTSSFANYVEQSPWEADSHSHGQEILYVLWYLKAHYTIPILSQMSPIHTHKFLQDTVVTCGLLASGFPIKICTQFPST
jgi:hypothetical protein